MGITKIYNKDSNKNSIYDVAVIGAGASGMMAAGYAAKRNLNVALIEKNEKPGRKIMITGKGRCNVTNDCTLEEFMSNVPWGGKFLFGAFSRFSASDVQSFFEELGVPLKVERGNRVFPVSDKSCDIVDALYYFVRHSGARFISSRVTDIIKEDEQFNIALDNRQNIIAKSVIIATGGKSYPTTGSTGDGYKLAEKFGHKIKPVRASLVPIETVEKYPRDLMGLSLRNVTLEVVNKQKNKQVFKELGEMLFTHFGVSGPLVLSASSRMRDEKVLNSQNYKLIIDLKPALNIDQMDKRLQRDFSKYSNKDYINSLTDLLPSKLIPIFVKLSEIRPDTKANQITKLQREKIAKLFKHLELTAKCFRPIEEAIITAGGVDFHQINPKTMESKLVKNLYFAGEIIDVDAYTGGFNLQIAFSTGFTAGNNVLL